MSLGRRLLVSLGIWTALYVAGVAVIHEAAVVERFDALEVRLAGEHAARVQEAITREVGALADMARVWAARDDAHTYAAQPNPEFEAATLSLGSVETSSLAALYVYDAEGALVYGRTLEELRAGSAGGPPPAYAETLRARCAEALAPDRRSGEGASGLVAVDGEVLMVAGESIFDSDRSEPSNGTFVLARALDEALLAELRDSTHVAFTAAPVGPAPVRASAPWIVSGNELHGEAWLADIDGRPALRLELRVPRDIHAEGRAAAWFALTTTVLGALLLLIALHAEVRRHVVQPLVRLSAEAVQVGASDGRHVPQVLQRDDELGVLSRGLAWMTECLAESRRELVAASRSAGRSEIAASVLHNVGNVLNAISVGSALLRERVGASELAPTLAGLRGIIEEQEQRGGLVAWLESDPRGPQFGALLCELAVAAEHEREQLETEARALVERVEHVRAVLTRHQGIARASNVAETFTLRELVAESERLARLPKAGSEALAITIESDREVVGQKHRLLEILVNLVNNATEALAEHGVREPRIAIRGGIEAGIRAWFEVEDNGPGIPAEVRESLFRMGFTTKASGSGIGLHSSANTALALGGALRLLPAEPGKGATFRFEFPLTVPESAARRAA